MRRFTTVAINAEAGSREYYAELMPGDHSLKKVDAMKNARSIVLIPIGIVFVVLAGMAVYDRAGVRVLNAPHIDPLQVNSVEFQFGSILLDAPEDRVAITDPQTIKVFAEAMDHRFINTRITMREQMLMDTSDYIYFQGKNGMIFSDRFCARYARDCWGSDFESALHHLSEFEATNLHNTLRAESGKIRCIICGTRAYTDPQAIGVIVQGLCSVDSRCFDYTALGISIMPFDLKYRDGTTRRIVLVFNPLSRARVVPSALLNLKFG